MFPLSLDQPRAHQPLNTQTHTDAEANTLRETQDYEFVNLILDGMKPSEKKKKKLLTFNWEHLGMHWRTHMHTNPQQPYKLHNFITW